MFEGGGGPGKMEWKGTLYALSIFIDEMKTSNW